MNKIVLVLILLTVFSFAEQPPPPWEKEGAKKDTTKRSLPPPFDKPPQQRDTVFVVVSEGDTTTKEYSIISPGREEYTVTRKTGEVVTHGVPPMKVICIGENIKLILSPKLVGAAGWWRNVQGDSLVWKGKVPKNQQLEINTSDWKQGKYYGGISTYSFIIIKE